MTAQEISQTLHALADAEIAEHSRRFFKTGRGQYGEGDRFLGIRVPMLRRQAKRFAGMDLGEVEKLLASAFHEERLCALLLLVNRFAKAGEVEQGVIYRQYLNHTAEINNWDLVDSSAPYIVGAYLQNRDRKPLYLLARSTSLWERRIAMMATFHMIRKNDFADALEIAAMLLDDGHDLIHKAAGWMLREIGKRDPEVEKAFLKIHCKRMPRTMLRYAIEKFPADERKAYLAGAV